MKSILPTKIRRKKSRVKELYLLLIPLLIQLVFLLYYLRWMRHDELQAVDVAVLVRQQQAEGTRCLTHYDKGDLRTLLQHCLPQKRGLYVQSAVIDWTTPLFQRPQHLATAYARMGFLVVYFTLNEAEDVQGYDQVADNIFVAYDYEDASDELGPLKYVQHALVSFSSTTYSYQFATHVSAVKKLNNYVVYEYIDEIDELISGDNVELLRANYRYVSGNTFNLVAASSRHLLQDIIPKVGEEQVVYVPNGVDYRHYRQPPRIPADSLARQTFEAFRRMKRPVIGYFGAMAPWLWYDLLREVVHARPGYTFVFLGPDYQHAASQLSVGNNSYWVGPVDYRDIPFYANQFDVAIIPFAPGLIAQSTSPLKLFEYFALHKPVVVTSDMVECVRFDVVFHGNTLSDFTDALDSALLVRYDPLYVQQLDDLARSNTWDQRAMQIVERFEQHPLSPAMHLKMGEKANVHA